MTLTTLKEELFGELKPTEGGYFVSKGMITEIIDRTYHATKEEYEEKLQVEYANGVHVGTLTTKEEMRKIIIEVLKKNAGSPLCDCSQALNEVRFALEDTTTSPT